ncbi:hypothetical protein KSP39_PZI016400 [Platanthera zijinensis]|uniref:Uncharacterized protein n=1 Tax=Platanthera zijinensis TaxID=2320716 RepID=A0AAP0G0S7_9ASPA
MSPISPFPSGLRNRKFRHSAPTSRISKTLSEAHQHKVQLVTNIWRDDLSSAIEVKMGCNFAALLLSSLSQARILLQGNEKNRLCSCVQISANKGHFPQTYLITGSDIYRQKRHYDMIRKLQVNPKEGPQYACTNIMGWTCLFKHRASSKRLKVAEVEGLRRLALARCTLASVHEKNYNIRLNRNTPPLGSQKHFLY